MTQTPHPAPQNRRLLVIGLDCAAPELIFDAWRSDLPTLSRLMEQGVYARMESCIPAITVPAWACMMSSRDPGQLGIYGFRNRADHSYNNMITATARSLEVPRLAVALRSLPPAFLESVEQTSDTVSRWKARSLGGKTVTWSAEIINEVPNVLIAWRSLDGSAVVSAGSVHFDEAGAGRGTRLRVRMQYSPPGGKLGTLAARMTGQDAATEVREDLRRFKQLLEAGEVATTEGQPRGRA